MARVSTYLNFMGQTEDAFGFYKSVFGTEYEGEVMRMGDVPSAPDMPELSETDKRAIMHIELPILGGHVLMATDMLEAMGHQLQQGNNVSINLEPDTRAETDRLYAALSDGGSEAMAPQEMFWGGYFGMCVDRFGTRWMFNCTASAS